MANEVTNPVQESLSLMDIGVERNGYGRQLDSRIAQLEPEEKSRLTDTDIEAVFIRAPVIRRVGEGAKVFARYQERSCAGGARAAFGCDIPSGANG